ncbi:MAG TPA: UvrD-helicase domain-containing protein [Nitrospirota bacterium]
MTDHIFDGLNESQKKAVTILDRPLLIVAGPGTGKTLTIVKRIGHLVRQGVKPENILAVTFTNRAAREMKERAISLLGEDAKKIFIGTFHLLGLGIMRASRGYDVTICSRDEQVELLRSLLNIPAKKARQTADAISRIKNDLDAGDDETRNAFTVYQSALRRKNAVDFDDLILLPIDILQNDPMNRFRERFTHIMVDEYQDINPVQYRLLKQLAGSRAHVCAIGDADQAIYGFRGADAGAFRTFSADFNNSAMVTLKENYRSTATVLSAALGLIQHNQGRIAKEIVPTKEPGRRVTVVSVQDERAEAEFIVRQIEGRIGGISHDRMRRAPGTRDASEEAVCFSDFGVIFRTNAQARALEEAFSASGIPYQVIGRKSSLQATEIAETLAYLRSLADSDGPDSSDSGDPEEAKLLTVADYFDPRADAVTLTTLHTAKGLEFRVVFIAGVEEGLLPYTRSGQESDIEEERRLFYVGLTRARDELFLVRARNRFLYGERLAPSPSPFFREIASDLMDNVVIPDRTRKLKEPDPQMGLF